MEKKGSHVELRIVKLKGKERKNKYVKATQKQRERRKQIFSTSHQNMMAVHVLVIQASIHVVVVQDNGCFHNESPCLLLFISQLLLLTVISYGMQHPFGQFRSATLEMSPPHLLPTPSVLALRVLERALMLCQRCSAIVVISVLLQLQGQSAALDGLLWGIVNTFPARLHMLGYKQSGKD